MKSNKPIRLSVTLLITIAITLMLIGLFGVTAVILKREKVKSENTQSEVQKPPVKETMSAHEPKDKERPVVRKTVTFGEAVVGVFTFDKEVIKQLQFMDVAIGLIAICILLNILKDLFFSKD